MRPDREAERADPRRGEYECPIAEERLSAKHWDDLRDHAHPRENHDVDGRVAVEPEDVLPEDG